MYQRILAPIGDREASSRGWAEAIALADLSRGRPCILHVVDEMRVAGGYPTGASVG